MDATISDASLPSRIQTRTVNHIDRISKQILGQRGGINIDTDHMSRNQLVV